MTPAVTTFAETAALYAVMEGDPQEARRIIDDMHPGEREIYAGQLNELLVMLSRYCQDCGEQIPHGQALFLPLTAGTRCLCRPCAGR